MSPDYPKTVINAIILTEKMVLRVPTLKTAAMV